MLSSITAIVPILCVTAAGIAAMLAEAFREPGERMPIAGLGLVGLTGAAVSAALLWGRHLAGFGVVVADTFGLFVVMTLAVIGAMTMLLSPRLVERDDLPGGEYYALTLFALAGMMLMAMATDLLVIFLALEVMSLAVYVLSALKRNSEASVEGAFKYFILGGFSSAFFLYGIAFVYGLTRTTDLERVGQALASQSAEHPVLALVALGLLLVGFGFKVSAVPFHMWTPDAYEGAPTIVSGFMSTGVKAAAFAALVRVMATSFHPLQAAWYPVIWGLAAVTMVLGTVVGVAQQNLKRMLAYSSIAHAGYMLVGLAATAANDVGRGAILFYLLAYGVTNLAAFAVIGLLATRERANDDLSSMAGLSNRHPALAAVFSVLLLSLGGIPPTAGFVGKWYIFSAAVRSGDYLLAIIGVLTSVVSIFFYLRVIVMMYMADPVDLPRSPAPSRAAAFTLAAAVVVTFYLGILPTPVLDLAARSIESLF